MIVAPWTLHTHNYFFFGGGGNSGDVGRSLTDKLWWGNRREGCVIISANAPSQYSLLIFHIYATVAANVPSVARVPAGCRC